MKPLLIVIQLLVGQFFLLTIPSYSQDTLPERQQIILGINEYRRFSLAKDPETRFRLIALVEKWDSLNISEADLQEFMYGVHNATTAGFATNFFYLR
jgi:hypothetical protein